MVCHGPNNVVIVLREDITGTASTRWTLVCVVLEDARYRRWWSISVASNVQALRHQHLRDYWAPA